MSIAKVKIALSKNTAWIKVVGRGTFQNSHPIKKWLLQKIEEGFNYIFIDLSECISMDSTFMGVIAGMAIILKDNHNTTLTLINVNSHNLNLLSTLGIDKFLNIISRKEIKPESLESIGDKRVSKKKLAKNMLSAHETLMSISEENKIKFQDVYEFLQKEIENT